MMTWNDDDHETLAGVYPEPRHRPRHGKASIWSDYLFIGVGLLLFLVGATLAVTITTANDHAGLWTWLGSLLAAVGAGIAALGYLTRH